MNNKKVNKLIMLHVSTSICNLKCHYCYLSQRDESFQGKQADMKYSPEQVAKALSPKRMGGICFINSCAEGETLLTKDIDLYYHELVKAGHYLEIVTNLTVTTMINKILSWEPEMLKRVEFKCSFHYLELKKRNLLNVFVNNVHNIWDAGASACIEVTPSDELIPYIDELKDFSIEQFGALPQLTIARDDRTSRIEKLTRLSDEEYKSVWGSFDSNFWNYKMQIFGVKQKGFCYAGLWSIYVDLATGNARACYYQSLGNIFEDPIAPLPLKPIGCCPIAHCYNGHAFLTFGLIPGVTGVRYGNIRNRIRTDGTEWLQPGLRDFFNGYLADNNKVWTMPQKKWYLFQKRNLVGIQNRIKAIIKKVKL